ncbi:hypothetical protein DACRYDRAFT_118202 [Dacryopinax primogenitus]|uniref:Signal recognition particle subunit SRP68 n=1 Tax=Dacryopinax primogenitus (strain DJM 731) TaxID=1858805 RepID=M5FZ87_DACPD|nr:uncharacterized protein DACRYDRAFT_118202 [Dacryopinax primogenitus]EJT98886.1 hypothetical protein DACRYDRAFT_118202 [Dacryopinax primogenitus]
MSELNVRPLSVVQQERAAFGLRSYDYARYRKHCTSKLHRLRQNLHVTHGKGKEYKKAAPIGVDKAQDGHILIYLFEAERAFSHAQELLNIPSEKHHAIARFRRSISHASGMLPYLSRLPTLSQAELAAYILMLRARFAIARRDDGVYNLALVQLASARALLTALSEAASSSRDVALYTSFLDTLAPEVRFLAHELGHPRAWDIPAVCADVQRSESAAAWPGFEDLLKALEQEKSKKGKGELHALVWEGKELQVREPELVELLIRVQAAQLALDTHAAEAAKPKQTEAASEGKKKRSKGKRKHSLLPAYDALLNALAEAEDLSRRLAEAQALGQQQSALAAPSTPGSGEGKEGDVRFLHAFVTYRLLASRIERDLLLVKMLENPPKRFTKPSTTDKAALSKTSGPAKDNTTKEQSTEPDDRTCLAIIRNLDSVLQSLEQMRELAVVQESLVVGEGIEGRIAFTRAKRIEYLARLYGSQTQYAEALALLERGHFYLRTLSPSLSSTKPSPAELAFYPLPSLLIQTLTQGIEQLQLKLKKEWYAATHKKPVFYDIAFNYIDQPLERIRARAGLAPEQSQQVTSPVAGAKGTKPAEVEKRQQVEHEEVKEEVKPQHPSGWSGYLGGWWGKR